MSELMDSITDSDLEGIEMKTHSYRSRITPRMTPTTAYSSSISIKYSDSSLEESYSSPASASQECFSKTISTILQKLDPKIHSVNKKWSRFKSARDSSETSSFLLNIRRQNSLLETCRSKKKKMQVKYARTQRELTTFLSLKDVIKKSDKELQESKLQMQELNAEILAKESSNREISKDVQTAQGYANELKEELRRIQKSQNKVNASTKVKRNARDALFNKSADTFAFYRKAKTGFLQRHGRLKERYSNLFQLQRYCEDKNKLLDLEFKKADMRLKMLQETEDLINYCFK